MLKKKFYKSFILLAVMLGVSSGLAYASNGNNMPEKRGVVMPGKYERGVIRPLTAAEGPKTWDMEIRNTYFYEYYSYLKQRTKGTSLSFVYRDLRGITVFGENIQQVKFGKYESLLKGGAAVKVLPSLTLQQTLGFSCEQNTFPNLLSNTEMAFFFWERYSLEPGYDLFMYNTVNVHVIRLGATYYPLPYCYINGKLFESIADFTDNEDLSGKTSFLVKAAFFINKRNEVSFLYADNNESFTSLDEIGDFKANTYSIGWSYNFYKGWWLTTTVTYQERKKPIHGNVRSIESGVIYKW